MSRKILSVLLAAFLVVGFASFITKADVTGSFSAFITIQPIDCSAFPFMTLYGTPPSTAGPGTIVNAPYLCEQTLQKSDFETGLIVNWTVSGLTLGINTVAGFTGIEHLLTSLKATLGALNITDQFFFAVPYGTDTLIIQNASQTQTDSEVVFTPICTGPVVKGVCPYSLLFVKKIVNISISIAGITLMNQAEIGDYTFPSAVTAFPCGKLGKPCSSLPAQVASYTTQNFAFGDALTISGQTVSGITVTNTTGINLNTNFYESFKKISFLGVLCQGVKEDISIVGIPVATGIIASEDLLFHLGTGGLVGQGGLPPCNGLVFGLPPFFLATTTIDLSTAIGAVEFSFTNSVPTSATLISGATLSISSGALSVTQTFNGLLQLSELSATLAATLNPDSNPAALTVTALICQDPLPSNCTYGVAGLETLNWTLAVQRAGVSFKILANLTGAGTVQLSKLEFIASALAGPVTLAADVTVPTTATGPKGPFWKGVFSFGISF